MTSARERILDRARYREHFASLIAGAARRDQRSRAQTRFDDERSQSKPRDDSVASRKILGTTGRARREFADEGTVLRNPRCELAMTQRKDEIGSGAEHGDGGGAHIERSRMRGSIDAFGEPARD